jgi:hypothetical protein
MYIKNYIETDRFMKIQCVIFFPLNHIETIKKIGKNRTYALTKLGRVSQKDVDVNRVLIRTLLMFMPTSGCCQRRTSLLFLKFLH